MLLRNPSGHGLEYNIQNDRSGVLSQTPRFSRWILPISLIMAGCIWYYPSRALCQTQQTVPMQPATSGEPAQPATSSTKPNEPPDSLEITEPDPLLPQIPVQRPLSPLERLTLSTALEGLEAEAVEARKQGDLGTAFKIWNRILRLQRFLGVVREVRALGQVGNIAWEENQPIQVRLIRDRLQTIQEQYLPDLTRRSTALPQIPVSERVAPDPSLRLPQLTIESVDPIVLQRALGIAYQQLRARQLALVVYEQQRQQAKQQGDRVLEQAALIIIGNLHFNWFDYANAVQIYRELLPFAPVKVATPAVKRSEDRALDDPPLLTKADILRRIVYMHEQDQQWVAAIAAQEELVMLLRSQQQTEVLPGLRLAIARNYRAADQLDEAIANYRQAYTLAQPLKQFGYASDALREVAALYLLKNQPQKALEIYQFLLEVDQQAYNTFGRMNTYDQIGQLYSQLGDRSRAIAAFQQGLALARQLKYREDYFLNKIEETRNSTPKTDPSNSPSSRPARPLF